MIDPQPKVGPITGALTAPRTPHRKRVQHWDRVNQGRMFTFSCYQRRPLLTDNRARVLLSRSIAAKLSQSPDHGWTLLGFVFMPEHVHLVMLPRSKDCCAAALLKAVKQPMSFQYKRLLEAEGSALLSELTIRERRGGRFSGSGRKALGMMRISTATMGSVERSGTCTTIRSSAGCAPRRRTGIGPARGSTWGWSCGTRGCRES